MYRSLPPSPVYHINTMLYDLKNAFIIPQKTLIISLLRAGSVLPVALSTL